jgi:hypothetical protein
VNIEPEVAPLSEVFRLQNAAELLAAEERYLPQSDQAATAPRNGNGRNDDALEQAAEVVVPEREPVQAVGGTR